jgi:cytochrome c biogenesis protein CcmG/thiol:disulfide interchange protein DsbE
MTTLAIGQSAPAFSLSGIDNKKYGLNQAHAKLTLAIFFKTTCPTCALAFPYFIKLHQAYGDAGLAVWGISQDERDESVAFASEHGSTFPILIDADLRVSREYDPEFVPTMFLIDVSGKIVDRILAFDKAGLNRVASASAQVLDTSVSIVAPDNDGNPPFKPG